MTKDSEHPPRPVDTRNEFILGLGNASHAGGGAYIAPQMVPIFSTQQQAYRFAAWCTTMAELGLPPEEADHSFDEIRDAIRNV